MLTITTPRGQPLAHIHMRSTLPVLDADRLPDGSVELSKSGALVFKYDCSRSDIPTRSTQTVHIKLTFYRLKWKPAK